MYIGLAKEYHKTSKYSVLNFIMVLRFWPILTVSVLCTHIPSLLGLRLGAFNVKVFGPSKASKEDVMSILARVSIYWYRNHNRQDWKFNILNAVLVIQWKWLTGLSPSREGMKDCFSVLPSQHLCRFMSACLAFVCTACTKNIAHYVYTYVKDPMSTFW